MKRQLTEAERERIEKNRREALMRRRRAMESEKNNGSMRSQTSNAVVDQGQRRELAGANRERMERNRQEPLDRGQLSTGVAGNSQSLPQQTNTAFGNRCQRNLPRTTSASSGLLSQILRGSASKSTNVNTNPVAQKRSTPMLTAPSTTAQNVVRPARMPSFGRKSKLRAVCVLVSREEFEVRARYHEGLVLVFKSMPTRIYDEKTKIWRFHLSDYRGFLRKAFAIDDIQLVGLSSAVVTVFKEKIDSVKSTSGQNEIRLEDWIPRHLIDSLMDFQREGVRFALKHEGRVLLADDMGLGKTVQALAVAAAYRSEWPLLVVAPLSLRWAWREAALRWLGPPPLSLSRADIHVVASLTDALDSIQHQQHRKLVTIFTYDLLSRYAESLGRTVSSFEVVIMDESHHLKNLRTSRTKSALPILQAAKRVILLTGTPALSRPLELYPQIIGIRPNLFRGGFHEFGLRYCAAKERTWGWDYSGCSNLQELHILLQETIMIRRVKSEVLGQLPPKFRQVVILDPDLVKKTPNGKNQRLENLASLDLNGVEKHGEMLRFFMQTCQAKIPAVSQYITDLLEEDRKFILYAHHQEMLDAITRVMESKHIEYIRIDGKTPSEQRRASCERFQNQSACRVALLSITTASTGLNLTAANLVVFAELFWNPGVLVQAEDRAHRIGQQDPVNIHYLLASGTVDDQLWALVKNKLEVLSQVGLNQESFDDVDLSRAKPLASSLASKIDQFFTSMNDSTTASQSIKENLQPEEEIKSSDATPQKDEKASENELSSAQKKPRISSLLPPVSSPPSCADDGCGGGRGSQILVPDSPLLLTLETTESLEDGADELLRNVLEAAVLGESFEL
ncbi:SWI/SNF-related matrix-associated actin-dependent regulator of chromatin subfamily A-like protein 1 [Echinococcus granulosus]|uniref:SWI:SNF matrix associated n=1 Tax=Echinococcus granulosus TaxID=6210 RepID=A0A068WQV2_ECHGR|nr:SWI/SNF-related matrix-associated actin-dependent regulator of chromatin subfamily A-like protein 1 [Echinococcus granulosus]CDS22513.1 SWI:SNF matrix associated [Echinococcus granulosus]